LVSSGELTAQNIKMRQEYIDSLAKNMEYLIELSPSLEAEGDYEELKSALHVNMREDFCKGFVMSQIGSKYLENIDVDVSEDGCDLEILNSGLDIIFAVLRENANKITNQISTESREDLVNSRLMTDTRKFPCLSYSNF
jgi:hypothetical protein